MTEIITKYNRNTKLSELPSPIRLKSKTHSGVCKEIKEITRAFKK